MEGHANQTSRSIAMPVHQRSTRLLAASCICNLSKKAPVLVFHASFLASSNVSPTRNPQLNHTIYTRTFPCGPAFSYFVVKDVPFPSRKLLSTILLIAHSPPAKYTDLVLDRVDGITDNGEDDEEHDDDDGDDYVFLGHCCGRAGALSV